MGTQARPAKTSSPSPTHAFFVYFLLFKTLVDPANPQIEALNSFSYQFLWEGEEPASRISVVGADINARYKHAVPSVLMAPSFLAALLVAFGLVLPRFGRVALPFSSMT